MDVKLHTPCDNDPDNSQKINAYKENVRQPDRPPTASRQRNPKRPDATSRFAHGRRSVHTGATHRHPQVLSAACDTNGWYGCRCVASPSMARRCSRRPAIRTVVTVVGAAGATRRGAIRREPRSQARWLAQQPAIRTVGTVVDAIGALPPGPSVACVSAKSRAARRSVKLGVEGIVVLEPTAAAVVTHHPPPHPPTGRTDTTEPRTSRSRTSLTLWHLNPQSQQLGHVSVDSTPTPTISGMLAQHLQHAKRTQTEPYTHKTTSQRGDAAVAPEPWIAKSPTRPRPRPHVTDPHQSRFPRLRPGTSSCLGVRERGIVGDIIGSAVQ